MKYIFILGRNAKLSVAEIEGFFIRNEKKIINKIIGDNYLVLDLERKLKGDEIKFIGGTIAIGEVLEEGNLEKVLENLDKKEIYLGKKNNINYSLWDFSSDSKSSEIFKYLKKRFKKEKLKASLKNLTGRMKLQSGKEMRIVSSKYIDEEYFLVDYGEGILFGKIIQKPNYEEIEKRDMEKPFRREALAISPRLAKIMINLSEIRSDEKLLDCFCGIGVFLEEALNQGLDVYGIDKDKKAIEGTKENLEWFKFPKEKYQLFNEDSSKIIFSENENFGTIVTEPDLGEILKKIPPKEKSKEILKNFENLMIKVLNNLKTNVEGKIVFTSPLIRTGEKRIGCNIERIVSKTNLSLVKEGIDEFREGQIVGRRIFVLK